MTKDDIAKMAREAGIDAWWDSGDEIRETLQDHLEHFAGIVAAAEREACAKTAEARKRITPEWQLDQHYNEACNRCAASIRTRGNSEG